VLVDSWAWIELFKKSPSCHEIERLLRGRKLFASVLSLAEVAHWCSRNFVPAEEYLKAIKENATILFVHDEIAGEAGIRLSRLKNISPGFGMIDSIIYTQAISTGLPLLTGDPHFKNLPGVEFIQ